MKSKDREQTFISIITDIVMIATCIIVSLSFFIVIKFLWKVAF